MVGVVGKCTKVLFSGRRRPNSGLSHKNNFLKMTCDPNLVGTDTVKLNPWPRGYAHWDGGVCYL